MQSTSRIWNWTKSLIWLLVTLCMTSATTYGTTFDYSYKFGSGDVVWGSLEGTQNGAFVDDVHDVTVFFNGRPSTGTIFPLRFDGTSSYPANWKSGAVVSFQAADCNFAFVNADFASGNPYYTALFAIVSDSNNGVLELDAIDILALAPGGLGPFVFNEAQLATSGIWSLQSVPEGGRSITMLALALAGLGWMRGRNPTGGWQKLQL
jgi:hypothetical protein